MTISESITPPVLPVATLSRTWSWLTTELRRRRTATTVAILVGLAAAALTTVPIYLLGSLVDRVAEGDDAGSLVGLSIVIGVTALVGGLGTVFGPVVGAFVIIAMQQYLAGFGQWVTVIQGVIFVVCVLTFRRGVVGEIAHYFRRSL